MPAHHKIIERPERLWLWLALSGVAVMLLLLLTELPTDSISRTAGYAVGTLRGDFLQADFSAVQN